MPLRALQADASSVMAIDYSPEQWSSLKAHLRREDYPWRLPCCLAPAVAKTSPRGLPFFAHKASAVDCSAAGETEHHRFLKACAVAAARAAGWEAQTEVRGLAPDGTPWIADVLATKGKVRIGVEIQWSRISDDELNTRHARYANSGVRCLWLINRNRVPSSQAIPAVRVRQRDDHVYVVRLPHHEFDRNGTEQDAVELPVNDLMAAAFSGRLRWGFRAGEVASYMLIGARQHCWKCNASTTIITSINLQASGTPVEIDLICLEAAGNLVDDLISERLRHEHRIGTLKKRYSHTAGESYLSNGCFECDSLQGRHYEHEILDSQTVVHSATTYLDSRWLAALSEADDAFWRVLKS